MFLDLILWNFIICLLSWLPLSILYSSDSLLLFLVAIFHRFSLGCFHYLLLMMLPWALGLLLVYRNLTLILFANILRNVHISECVLPVIFFYFAMTFLDFAAKVILASWNGLESIPSPLFSLFITWNTGGRTGITVLWYLMGLPVKPSQLGVLFEGRF